MPILVDKLDAARRYIPNLRAVSENVVRGGQPEPEGLSLLYDAGVRLVINLRSAESGLAGLFRRSGGYAPSVDPDLELERKKSREVGLKFVNIPLDVFGHPDEEHIHEFLSLTAFPDSEPFFVHCLHGRDRTGLMMAVYRVMAHEWSAEKAYAEMVECGFDKERTNLSDALFQFAKKHASG